MSKFKFIPVACCFLLTLMGCSSQVIRFAEQDFQVMNRKIDSINKENNALALNREKGDGVAILKEVKFEKGELEIELRGEDNPGKSFVGIAFNIQNDSTYEAIYFRPFNFQSEKAERRKHAVQYIYHPQNTWRYLRTHFPDRYESEFPRRPSPNEWFKIRIKIDDKEVKVFDMETKTELISIQRLTEQISDSIGLWTGFNSKGEFRNLKIRK